MASLEMSEYRMALEPFVRPSLKGTFFLSGLTVEGFISALSVYST